MKIAIASGKGGTGKTTIATNLALALAASGRSVAYLDCDVEEPNGHIFLQPDIDMVADVTTPIPLVDEDKCTYCGACGDACRYSAILVLMDNLVTFPELCHGCGGCTLACDQDAIVEIPRVTGRVEKGIAGNAIQFVQGKLDVGEAMSPPVIRAVIDASPQVDVTIRDAPPGTTCPVMESVRDADVVLLVTEPTPFGLNDLVLAVEMIRTLGLPFGVAVNRSGVGNREVFEYCERENIEVLLEIPDDRKVAELYSRGEPIAKAVPGLEQKLLEMVERLGELSGARIPVPSTVAVPFHMPEDLPDPPSVVLPEVRLSDVQEIVVVSGKGGTGKTSVVASMFALAGDAVIADCDVDAADLHLVLSPRIKQSWPFTGGASALVDENGCVGAFMCIDKCRFDAIQSVETDNGLVSRVDALACEGCGVCSQVCPTGVISMVPTLSGSWSVSNTRHGPMVHARLAAAGENSGKLVSLVRQEARAVAVAEGRNLVMVDGSPGIGCPVIASVTGARMVMVVAEPTLSGLHDMSRVAQLTNQFGIDAVVCVNKFDINPRVTESIEKEARALGLHVLGRIRYDPAVTEAQVLGLSVVEYGNSPAAEDISKIYSKMKEIIGGD